MTVIRPLIRYHGGKFLLAKWIISHFPEHRMYVEPYGGGGSVLLRKIRSHHEIYNDLDQELINLFTVARDSGSELKEKLILTPFSREEFKLSYQESEDPIEQARRTVVRAYQGFGTNSHTKNTGFRPRSRKSGTSPAMDFRNYPAALDFIIDRLRGVVIENRPAIQVIKDNDHRDTLFYLDPPYLPETRDPGSDYRFEMTEEDHVELLETALSLKGHVIISCYPNGLYSQYLKSFQRTEKRYYTHEGKKRTEVLYMNVKGQEGLFERLAC